MGPTRFVQPARDQEQLRSDSPGPCHEVVEGSQVLQLGGLSSQEAILIDTEPEAHRGVSELMIQLELSLLEATKLAVQTRQVFSSGFA
jgi:hypothetical protein